MHDEHKGYVHLTQIKEIEEKHYSTPPVLQKIDADDKEYLDKIVSLCQEKDIKLIFLYAPFSLDKDSYNNNYTVKCYAEERGIDYIDATLLTEQLGLDFKTDFYDSGHLNYTGSVKLSQYLAQYLVDNNICG